MKPTRQELVAAIARLRKLDIANSWQAANEPEYIPDVDGEMMREIKKINQLLDALYKNEKANI